MVDEYFHDLLKTKIYIPPLRDGLVPRPRLVERMNNGIRKKLILVHAPAGYGKTTLVIEWLSQVGNRHAMYSVDQTDNELPRFLTYIIFALKQVDPHICDTTLPLIHSPDTHPMHVILAHLINDLTCLQAPTTLVIDDYQLVHSAEIHEAVSFLLHNMPPALQLVLVSRRELPFPISDLRAGNQMLELGTFDLRFTKLEIDAFVKGILELDLSPEALEELDRKTEGWITSLQLAVMGASGREIGDHFHELSGSDRLIAEYLMDQVIERQAPEIRDFLLKTSILDRFCASLCDEVGGYENSAGLIQQVQESNLFVVPLDNVQEWYRYHHLFSQFLQNRLRAEHPEELPVHWKKASTWHAAHGNREEAVEYALKAGDYDGCADLVQPVVSGYLARGGRDRVIRWLSSFPKELLRKRTALWPFLLFANMDKGTFANAYRAINDLWGEEEYISAMPSQDQPLIRGFRAGFLAGIMIHTTLDANVVKNLAQQSTDNFPLDAGLGRSIGFGHFGSACLHSGDLAQARIYLDRAIETNKREGYEGLFRLWSSYRADVEVEAGNLHRAQEMIDKVLEFATERGVRESNVTSNATIGLGRILFEWNRLDEAESLLGEAVRTAESGEYLDRLMLAYQHYFGYLMAMKDFDTARKKIAHARRAAAAFDNPKIICGRIDALETWIDIESGAVESGTGLSKLLKDPPVGEIIGLYEFKWHMMARAWVAAGRYRESIGLLGKLYEDACLHDRGYSMIQTGISLVRAHLLEGNGNKARRLLVKLLDRTVAEGYVRSFLDGGNRCASSYAIWHKIPRQGLIADRLPIWPI